MQTPETTTTAPAGDDEAGAWAIVELFGHRRVAGRVREEIVCGLAMLRVTVPDVVVDVSDPAEDEPRPQRVPGSTASYAARSIYAINWSSEGDAVAVAQQVAQANADAAAEPF